MARNVKRPKHQPTYIDVAGMVVSSAGQRISENPALAGSGVVFAVVMFYVSTNALFYQPHRHKDALFSTRSMHSYVAPDLPKPMAKLTNQDGGTQSFKVTRETAMAPAKQLSDPTLADIQTALAQLKMYSGSVDGLPGPKTRAAITKFQQEAGLEPTGEIDPLLLDAIRTASIPAEKVPAPALKNRQVKAKPTVKPVSAQEMPQALAEKPLQKLAQNPVREPVDIASDETAASGPAGGLSDADIMRLQAGLKAFGNDSIDVDGKIGGKTRDAIREFQTLFQLTVSGEPNREVLGKLQEIGLVAG
jgi:peptidoglycan hydrolase-like protein with peptidoglycan-binding domain